MFQLYKARNFNSIINDTFTFFKIYGKNYFKNYFIINGGLLLILVVIGFIIGKVFIENIMSGTAGSNSPEMMGTYFSENFGLMLGLGSAAFLLLLLVSIINYAYPVVYLKVSDTHKTPDSKQLWAVIKSKIGKAIIFGLMSLISFFPLAILVGLFALLMIVIIVGIPVAIIIFAAYTCWIYLTFYDYLTSDNSYFTSMGVAWQMLFKNFWAHMGSTAIFYAILYVLQLVFVFLGFIIQSLSGLVNVDPNTATDVMATMSITMIISFIIQTVIGFVIGNFIMVNQGMIYYSCIEQDENRSLENEIDLIGSDVE